MGFRSHLSSTFKRDRALVRRFCPEIAAAAYVGARGSTGFSAHG